LIYVLDYTRQHIHKNGKKKPTQQYQKMVKQTLKQCKNIIQKEEKWKYINMNPTAAGLYATIKLHKHNTPIRPIINWKNAPAYKLAKQLSKIFHSYNSHRHTMYETLST
jgi:hypothetical protein